MSNPHKPPQQRINTTDTIQSQCYMPNTGPLSPYSNPPIIESHRQLQFRYKTLEHQYGMLENQFQVYSSETFNRIQSLERDMDNLVEEKERAIRALTLENKNVKEENIKQRVQIQSLRQQNSKLSHRISCADQQFRDTVFSHQIIQKKQRQIVMNFQRQLNIKIEQVQNLKQILNNERIIVMNKDELLINKQNQIGKLLAELRRVEADLGSRLEIEGGIRQANCRLKREIEELTVMFGEMEANIRNCQKCKILQLKNMELLATIRAMKGKQNRLYAYAHAQKSRQRQNIRGASFTSSHIKTQFSLQKRPHRNRYVGGDYTIDTIQYEPERDRDRQRDRDWDWDREGRREGLREGLRERQRERQAYFGRTTKDSVVRRCRNALDMV